MLDPNHMIDNAATASQNDFDDVTREAILLNIIQPMSRNKLPESNEALGEMIYRAMYEHQGGKWWANESKGVWYQIAERLRYLVSP